MSRLGSPEQLIETRVDRVAREEVNKEISDRGIARLAKRDPKPGLGKSEGLLHNHLPAHAEDALRESAGGGIRNAPGLSQHPHGRVDYRDGQGCGGRGKNESIRRERNIPFSYADGEVDPPRVAALGVELEIGRHDLAVSLGHEVELEHPGIAGPEGWNAL